MTARALLIGAVVLAAAPMLAPGLPVGADTVTHLYTLVHVEDLLRHGVLFSRWLPWQNGGLGNPRFLFYPWLPYYAAEPLVLLGVTHGVALKASFVGALVLAAAGCFAWCRQWTAARASAVAAATYVLSPYLLFAAYARASFAEVVALGVAPWALGAAMRWRARPGAASLAASASLAALTLLCHPITGGLLLLPWVALHVGGDRDRRRPQVVGALAALALALGASAVLWLPARAERREISDIHTQSTGLDYRHNFVPARQLVAWRAPSRLEPGLGMGALVLALAGLTARRRAAESGAPRWVLVAAAAGFSLLVLPAARLLWLMTDQFARDVQFPHRLLAPASLLLAGLVADGATAVLGDGGWTRSRWRHAAVGALAMLVASSAVPLLHRGRLRHVPPLDVDFIVAKERIAGLRGFGYAGEFMPASTPFLSAAWRAAPEPRHRLSASSLPPEARVLATEFEPLRYAAVVQSPTPWRAVWKTLAFPGWSATIDGRPTRVVVTPEGLLAVDVPAGRREAAVAFGSTPARHRGQLISALSALALLALALAGRLARLKQFAKI